MIRARALVVMCFLTVGCQREPGRVGIGAVTPTPIPSDTFAAYNLAFAYWSTPEAVIQRNYGYEDAPVSHWKVNVDAPMTIKVTRVVENGNTCARFEIVQKTNIGHYAVLEQFFPDSAKGGNMTITARVKTTSPGVQLMPGFFPGGFLRSNTHSGSGQWETLTAHINVPDYKAWFVMIGWDTNSPTTLPENEPMQGGYFLVDDVIIDVN